MAEDGRETADHFIERMGLVFEADGMPRIAGRIMAFLIVFKGPYSFGDLARRLKVSRGSVSTNTRLLERLGIIERVTLSGERQDYFQIRPNPYQEVIKGTLERMRKARSIVDETMAELPGDWTGACERLGELETFYGQLIGQLESMIEAPAEARSVRRRRQ